MKRTTVKIPEELDARLRHEAARRGTTISAITREALEAHLGGEEPGSGEPPVRRRLFGAGSFNSGDGALSVRVDELMKEILERKRRDGTL